MKSFENIKMTSDIRNVDKKINKELEENKKYKKSKKPIEKPTSHRKTNTLGNDSKSVIRTVQKKTGTKSMPKKVGKKKITAKKSSR